MAEKNEERAAYGAADARTADPRAVDAQAAQSAGFAAQAARLVEAARVNERAVRDLEEAAQLLAEGVDDLVRAGDLAQAVRDLADRTDAVRAASEQARAAVEAADGLDRVRRAAEDAAVRMAALGECLDDIGAACARLEGAVRAADERLTAALEGVEGADFDAALGRIDALERKVDRVLDLLESHADAYTARIEPRLTRLEAIAERMDAPAVADELADVLATNYLLYETINACREENAQAQDWFDARIAEHLRNGGHPCGGDPGAAGMAGGELDAEA